MAVNRTRERDQVSIYAEKPDIMLRYSEAITDAVPGKSYQVSLVREDDKKETSECC